MGPKRIICLTEESVEFLYRIGEEDRILGVSAYVERPLRAKKEKKVVSVFTHAQTEKIVSMKPDLVIGFSDIQKDIARDLIGAGLDVWISNQRSLNEILDYLEMLGRIVNSNQAVGVVSGYRQKLDSYREKNEEREHKPRLYLEEWDEPMISGISWFSEIVEACGGKDIFSELRQGSLAKDRFVNWDAVLDRRPDGMLASWCGKKVDFDSIRKRQGAAELSIYELDPAIYLQPGPALFETGLDQLTNLINQEFPRR